MRSPCLQLDIQGKIYDGMELCDGTGRRIGERPVVFLWRTSTSRPAVFLMVEQGRGIRMIEESV